MRCPKWNLALVANFNSLILLDLSLMKVGLMCQREQLWQKEFLLYQREQSESLVLAFEGVDL